MRCFYAVEHRIEIDCLAGGAPMFCIFLWAAALKHLEVKQQTSVGEKLSDSSQQGSA